MMMMMMMISSVWHCLCVCLFNRRRGSNDDNMVCVPQEAIMMSTKNGFVGRGHYSFLRRIVGGVIILSYAGSLCCFVTPFWRFSVLIFSIALSHLYSSSTDSFSPLLSISFTYLPLSTTTPTLQCRRSLRHIKCNSIVMCVIPSCR